MDTTVIVALPAVDDRVNKVSSEDLAHLTLVYMANEGMDLESVLRFVEHASSQMSPFGLSVEYRDKLGDEDADVLFFDKNSWDMERVADFRHHLLLNDSIRAAYDRVEQYPEWTPHLTLGYPDKPAKDEELDYGISYVNFDRIAVWSGDFIQEFRLKYDDHAGWQPGVAHGDTTGRGAVAAAAMFKMEEDALSHYGVKGMKWGVRKDDKTSRGGADKGPTAVVVQQKKPGKFAKASGGKRHEMTEDAARALTARQKAKSSTTDALTNQELRQAIERMQLEQQYTALEYKSDRRNKGARFAAGLFGVRRYDPKKKERRFQDSSEFAGDLTRKAGSAAAKKAAARVAAAAV